MYKLMFLYFFRTAVNFSFSARPLHVKVISELIFMSLDDHLIIIRGLFMIFFRRIKVSYRIDRATDPRTDHYPKGIDMLI